MSSSYSRFGKFTAIVSLNKLPTSSFSSSNVPIILVLAGQMESNSVYRVLHFLKVLGF